jgi:hypothetical protein
MLLLPVLIAASLVLPAPRYAQCPDGAPPPCNRTRTRPAAPPLRGNARFEAILAEHPN